MVVPGWLTALLPVGGEQRAAGARLASTATRERARARWSPNRSKYVGRALISPERSKPTGGTTNKDSHAR
jgi:hypothetical protein